MSNLFRKSVIDKLSSPEQLDKTIVVTTPLSALAIVAFFIIIAAVSFWALFGSTFDTMEMQGYLIDSGYTNAQFSTLSGRVTVTKDDYVKEGDRFKPGDPLLQVQDRAGRVYEILADSEGVVGTLLVHTGDVVPSHAEIMRYSPVLHEDESEQMVVCYVPEVKAVQIRQLLEKERRRAEAAGEEFRGLEIMAYPAGGGTDTYIEGHLVCVDSQVADQQGIALFNLGETSGLVQQVVREGAVYTVSCTLKIRDGRYVWHKDRVGTGVLNYLSRVRISMIVNEQRPIEKLLGH